MACVKLSVRLRHCSLAQSAPLKVTERRRGERERERERDGEGEGGRRERTEEVGRERGESNRSINDGVREATAIRDGSAKSDNENHFGYQLLHQQSE